MPTVTDNDNMNAEVVVVVVIVNSIDSPGAELVHSVTVKMKLHKLLRSKNCRWLLF